MLARELAARFGLLMNPSVVCGSNVQSERWEGAADRLRDAPIIQFVKARKRQTNQEIEATGQHRSRVKISKYYCNKPLKPLGHAASEH